MTVAELDAQITALVTALGNGVEQVRFPNGSSVTYRSAADMQARLTALRSERDRLVSGAVVPGVRLRSYPVVMIRDR